MSLNLLDLIANSSLSSHINFSQYLFIRLVSEGLENVFGVTGGGIMHLTDAISRNENLKFTCFQHEANSGFAADSYFKASGKTICVLSTTGPGAANVFSSIVSSWQVCLYFKKAPNLSLNNKFESIVLNIYK